MNEFQKRLMDKPSISAGGWCPFCDEIAQQRHHIVPRSQGGTKGPTVEVCGLGNSSGCHGKLHKHLIHLDWNDDLGCWEYIELSEPAKFEIARQMDGWKPL